MVIRKMPALIAGVDGYIQAILGNIDSYINLTFFHNLLFSPSLHDAGLLKSAAPINCSGFYILGQDDPCSLTVSYHLGGNGLSYPYQKS
jgi:hypothetical protein